VLDKAIAKEKMCESQNRDEDTIDEATPTHKAKIASKYKRPEDSKSSSQCLMADPK